MTQEELAGRLALAGLPTVYRAFRTEQAPPFLCYRYVYDAQFYADNKIYYSSGHYQVELYTSQKDLEAEAKVETALNGLCWEKAEEYIEEEQIYQITYEIEV